MKVILAVSPNYGIADDNGNLLYHNKNDIRLFKGLTYGCPVIAGYRTAKTLEGGLKGRECFVDSKESLIGWQALKSCRPQNAWVIGGAKTVSKRLDTITEFWLSVFKADPGKTESVYLCDRTVDLIKSSTHIRVASFDDFDLVRFIA